MITKTATKYQSKLVNDWNDRHDVGTPVRYWKGMKVGEGAESKTRTPATLLGGHTAVVFVEGVSGCVALTHVEPIADES